MKSKIRNLLVTLVAAAAPMLTARSSSRNGCYRDVGVKVATRPMGVPL